MINDKDELFELLTYYVNYNDLEHKTLRLSIGRQTTNDLREASVYRNQSDQHFWTVQSKND